MTDRISLVQGSWDRLQRLVIEKFFQQPLQPVPLRNSRMGSHMRLRNVIAVWIACLLAGASALFGETRVVVENEAVRILSATQAPGEKTPLHRHQRNRVVVFLDNGDLRVFDEQGNAKDEHWSAGQTVWSGPTGMHI